MSETIIVAVLAALGGGIGLEVLRRITPPAERRLDDAQKVRDEAVKVRDEWREEVKTLREEVKALRVSVDDWQLRYYKLQGEHAVMKAQMDEMTRELALLRRPDKAGRRSTDPEVCEPPDPGMG